LLDFFHDPKTKNHPRENQRKKFLKANFPRFDKHFVEEEFSQSQQKWKFENCYDVFHDPKTEDIFDENHGKKYEARHPAIIDSSCADSMGASRTH